MADGFDVRVTGAEAYQRKLEQFRLHLSDLRGYWPLLVPVVHSWSKQQFESEGEWGGQQWAPLSPQYAAEKAQSHPGRSILIRDGDMRRAASQMRREQTPRTLVMWIDDPKAPLHQEGGDNLPARPLIPDPLPASARRDIALAAEEYVSVLVRRLGL
jgi:hypothetical protein